MPGGSATAPPGPGETGDAGVAALRALLDDLPAEARAQVFTHASWSGSRAEAYGRLAFLGDSVLGLAVTSHLYPRLEAEAYGEGRLTKIRAQAVSGPSCRVVAERLGVPERLAAAAPEGTDTSSLATTERVLASITEAIIGACYLEVGYDRIAEAVVAAFADRIEEALEHPVDFKSALQERLAQRARVVAYRVSAEHGPPHARTFDVEAAVGEEVIGRGTGRSKKAAEQEAARLALEGLR